MDRLRFFYEQTVTPDDLNGLQDNIESSVFLTGLDAYGYGLRSGSDGIGGEVKVVKPTSSVSSHVVVDAPSTGSYVVRDKAGRRIPWSEQVSVDCSTDYLGNTTAVPSGSSRARWVSVFASFKRNLSTPKTDGNGNQVYYEQDEGVEFFAVQGALGDLVNGLVYEHGSTESLLARPACPSSSSSYPYIGDAIRLADVCMTESGTVTESQINTDKRDDWFRMVTTSLLDSGGQPYKIVAGTPAEGLLALFSMVDTVLGGVGSSNFWTHIGASDSDLPNYADGTQLSAGTAPSVKDVFVQLITDLAGSGGAARIGVTGTTEQGHAIFIASGTLQAALQSIITKTETVLTALGNADATLQGDISAEALARASADSSLAETIGSEISSVTSAYTAAISTAKSEAIASGAAQGRSDTLASLIATTAGNGASLVGVGTSVVPGQSVPTVLGALTKIVALFEEQHDTGGRHTQVKQIFDNIAMVDKPTVAQYYLLWESQVSGMFPTLVGDDLTVLRLYLWNNNGEVALCVVLNATYNTPTYPTAPTNATWSFTAGATKAYRFFIGSKIEYEVMETVNEWKPLSKKRVLNSANWYPRTLLDTDGSVLVGWIYSGFKPPGTDGDPEVSWNVLVAENAKKQKVFFPLDLPTGTNIEKIEVRINPGTSSSGLTLGLVSQQFGSNTITSGIADAASSDLVGTSWKTVILEPYGQPCTVPENYTMMLQFDLNDVVTSNAQLGHVRVTIGNGIA